MEYKFLIEPVDLQEVKAKLNEICSYISKNHHPPDTPVFIGVSDCCQKYSISRSFFEEKIKKAIRTYKIGGKVMVKVSELEAYFEASKRSNG